MRPAVCVIVVRRNRARVVGSGAVRRWCRPALHQDRPARAGAGTRRLQDHLAQRRGRDPWNAFARWRAAELPPQAGPAGPGTGVGAGLVTRANRDGWAGPLPQQMQGHPAQEDGPSPLHTHDPYGENQSYQAIFGS